MSNLPLILPVKTSTDGIIQLMFQIINELELKIFDYNNNVVCEWRFIIDYVNAFYDIVNITFNNVVFNDENIVANSEIYQIIVKSLIAFNKLNTPIVNFTIDTSQLPITRNKSKSANYIEQVNNKLREEIIFNTNEAIKIDLLNNINSSIIIIKNYMSMFKNDYSLIDISTNLVSNTVRLKTYIYEAINNIYNYAQNYNIINKIINITIKNGYTWTNTDINTTRHNNNLRNTISYIFNLAYQIQNFISGLCFLLYVSTLTRIDLNKKNETVKRYDMLINIRKNIIDCEVLLNSQVKSILDKEKQNDIYKNNINNNINPYYYEIIFNEKKHLLNLASNRLCIIRTNYYYNKFVNIAEFMHNNANNAFNNNTTAFKFIQEEESKKKCQKQDINKNKDKNINKDKENIAYALLQLKNSDEEHVNKKRRVSNEV
jgi:hypothetical protein